MAEKWTGKIERPLRIWVNPRITDDIYLHFIEILKAVKYYAPRFHGTILDIGAGKAPYRRFFTNAARYIKLENHDYPDIDIVADATKKIPLKDSSVDHVVCFQVLEHVPEPQKLVNEIHRVLKPGGYCLLMTHMAAPLHGEPYDYYRFTKYALQDIFKKFTHKEVKENGGAALSIVQLAVWGVSEKLPSFLSKPLVVLLNLLGVLSDKLFYSSVFTLNYAVFAVK